MGEEERRENKEKGGTGEERLQKRRGNQKGDEMRREKKK